MPTCRPFLPVCVLVSHILLLMSTEKLAAAVVATSSNEIDREALLAIKDRVDVDPFQVLDSWNGSLHFCRWQGVTCGRRHQRVSSLKLTSLHLAGTLSPFIGNLSFLTGIDLGGNSFRGVVPPELGRLARLRNLILQNNSFEGTIPTNLTLCSKLETVNLGANDLTGRIPDEFGSLSRLTLLGLGANQLSGTIPPSLGNLSFLTVLSFTRNNLRGGIPDELARLRSLQILRLFGNNLTGEVPRGIFNISSLNIISVAVNLLEGQLPPDLGFTLPNLQQLFIGGNQFSGPLPKSLANASQLTSMDISDNLFAGPPTLNWGAFQDLEALNLNFDPLFATSDKGDILSFFNSLSNCTKLTSLQLARTNLTGAFPNVITNLSTSLTYLRLDQNSLSGELPKGIGNLFNVMTLALDYNKLSGDIPDSIGKLTKLQELTMSMNKLSGKIPASIGNLPLLGALDLSGNMLEGDIPISLEDCKLLQVIDLSSNNLTGMIPEQVFSLPSLSIGLFLDWNRLTDPLPLEVGNLRNIQQLTMQGNQLSGAIPSTLGSCVMLEFLDMGGNNFEGTIPTTFDQLRGLGFLNLSHNNLSGEVPEFLGELYSLSYLDLSYNEFDGQVPEKGVFANASAFLFSGNKRLCGGIHQLQLPPCATPVSTRSKKHIAAAAIVLPVVGGVACVGLLAFVYWKRKQRIEVPPSNLPVLNHYCDLSYHDLLQATGNFSSDNLLGSGSFGYVYKGTLNTGQLLAIKVFNLNDRRADKSFVAECEALKNIRHRNLVKIVSVCSSIDFKGQDFKALVYEFMPNGDLDSWLHPDPSTRLENPHNLTLMQRLNIATHIANALEYLHHHSQEPIVHCDLKPSNILLDTDLVAHVGDFGLARLIDDTSTTSSHSQTTSTVLKGTIGYVAPEYGTTKEVSTQGDVYSYGIIILELITGRRPTDGTLSEGLTLHRFVEIALRDDHVMEIIDPRLMINKQAGKEEEENRSSGTHDSLENGSSNCYSMRVCLAQILQMGLMCSAESPRERMDIRDALKQLDKAKRMLPHTLVIE